MLVLLLGYYKDKRARFSLGSFSGLLKVIFPSLKLFTEGVVIVFFKVQLQKGGERKKKKKAIWLVMLRSLLLSCLPPPAPTLLPLPGPAAGDGASPFHPIRCD